MLVAVFAAASEGSKAVPMALGKLVHSSKPPPLELLSKVLTSMNQLELCTGGGHHDQHTASIYPTEVEKFASIVLTTDTPSNTDDNSKEWMHHRTKWAIVKRIVNNSRNPPEETVVDKALAEAVAGVIEEACVTGKWEGLDVVGALVDAIIESLEEPPVKYALMERLILACKPAQDKFSGNKVLRDGFKVVVHQLQRPNADQKSPLQALTGAIRRLPVDSLLQMNLVEALRGAYEDAKAAGQEGGKGEEEGKGKVEEEEVDAGWLLDQGTIDRLIAAKQRFRISSIGSAAANKFAQQRRLRRSDVVLQFDRSSLLI